MTLLASCVGLAACWPAPLERVAGDGGPLDAQPGAAFQSLAPCRLANDYETSGTNIAFGGALGTSYSPRCLTVATGTSLSFSGQFGEHPLHPSTRGTLGSPIVTTKSGATATFVFTQPGFFPYYCGAHGDSSGGGMSGVVQVVP